MSMEFSARRPVTMTRSAAADKPVPAESAGRDAIQVPVRQGSCVRVVLVPQGVALTPIARTITLASTGNA